MKINVNLNNHLHFFNSFISLSFTSSILDWLPPPPPPSLEVVMPPSPPPAAVSVTVTAAASASLRSLDRKASMLGAVCRYQLPLSSLSCLCLSTQRTNGTGVKEFESYIIIIIIIIINKFSIALFPVKKKTTSSARLITNVHQMSENGSMLPH